MRIGLVCDEFVSYTGLPMYIYELSRNLVEQGHSVSVVTGGQITGEVRERSRDCGVGVIPLYGVTDDMFDIFHANMSRSTRAIVDKTKRTPIVCSVHSQYSVARPYVGSRILKYICVRDEIARRCVSFYGVNERDITVIPNGVDFDRFGKAGARRDRKTVMFAGTVDRLRKESMFHLIDRAKSEDFDVWFVGEKILDYLDDHICDQIRHFNPVWKIEELLSLTHETAGVLLGRTTMEGWANGIGGWIYNIDLNGNIVSVDFHDVPENVDDYNIENVSKKVYRVYEEAINAFVS
jgi:glycosyltransferase involved in cell wall biosynthesis